MALLFSGLPVASVSVFFFFNDTATTEIYTLSLHDALPICFGIRTSDLLGRRFHFSPASLTGFPVSAERSAAKMTSWLRADSAKLVRGISLPLSSELKNVSN